MTRKKNDPDGWIYRTYADWNEDFALSEYQVRRACNNLKGKNKGNLNGKPIIKTKIKKVQGNPTLHYLLDIEAFIDCFMDFIKTQKAPKTVVSLETKETILDNLQERICRKLSNESVESAVSNNTEYTTKETTTATKSPSQHFSKTQTTPHIDTEKIMESVPVSRRCEAVQKLIDRFVHSHGVDYVLAAVVHTNNRPEKRKVNTVRGYASYLGLTLENGWGAGCVVEPAKPKPKRRPTVAKKKPAVKLMMLED